MRHHEPMFDGFTEEMRRGRTLDLLVRHAGAGPPLLLLHGHPRTSSTWHRVAPLLVERGLTIVCPDLPGYGRSDKPSPTTDHSAHSKRAGAAELVAMMRGLGHERFSVAGHDRGALYAFRAALDHSEHVTAAVMIDAIPVIEHLDRTDARFAGLGVDRSHDAADRAAGRRIGCPLSVLWAERDDLEDLHGDPRAIWRAWADDVDGHSIDSGHHMAEEAPDELATAIGDFVLARQPH